MISKPHSFRHAILAGVFATGSVFAIAPAAQAASAKEEAASTVDQAVEITISALQDSSISDAEAADIIELVDVDRVAQFSLGNHWETINEDQKARYTEAFRIYAKSQLKEHLSGLSQAEIKVTDVVTRGDDDAIVETQVYTNGQPDQKLSWRVINRDGWSIVDIQVHDIWFAIEQRAQFGAMLDKNNGDVDVLIAELSGGNGPTKG